MDWQKSIVYIQGQIEKIGIRAAGTDPGQFDETIQFVWKRLQMGHRTQDLYMQIETIEALQSEAVGKSPAWEDALKYLAVKRAQGSNLMLEMIWKQVEAGDRSPELLAIVEQQKAAEVAAAKPAETAKPPKG